MQFILYFRRGVSDTAVTSAEKLACAKTGDRIECNGEYGTIKYIGPVEGHPGIWLGIDWDNHDRGKHDGTVNGKLYFTARYIIYNKCSEYVIIHCVLFVCCSFSKSGSFVRPEKVHFGQSAIDSITSRYGNEEDEFTARINQQQLLKMQQEIKAPFLQLVGFDDIINKQR